ncbi:MAG: hypothetical protein RLZZ59_826 [Pseudomonadota bacterium]|jgi:hypothetical protein
MTRDIYSKENNMTATRLEGRGNVFGAENKYTPSQLYQAAGEIFQKHSEISNDPKLWALTNKEVSIIMPPASDVELTGDEDRDRAIIMPPASDVELTGDEDRDRAILGPQGGLSIQKAIEKSKGFFDLDNPVKHIFIPIAQSRKVFFGLFGPKRSHFTYIKLYKDDHNTIHATHYDSKGFFGRLYPLKGIKEALLTTFKDKLKDKLSAVYTGQQGFFDDHNCGRYTLAGIQKSVENNGNAPDKITKLDLDGIDDKYKSYIQKQSSAQKALPNTEVTEQDGFAIMEVDVPLAQNRRSWREGEENKRGIENVSGKVR